MGHDFSFRFLERITGLGAQVLRSFGWAPASAARPRDPVGAPVFRAATEKLAPSAALAQAALETPEPETAATAALVDPLPAEVPSRKHRDAAPGTVGQPGPVRPDSLSTDEQAAFQAIAAMLGPRADARALPRAAAPNDQGESVPRDSGLGLPKVTEENAAILDLVPLGIIVFRDLDPIFVNRFLLDLLDVTDLRGVRGTGRLDAITRHLSEATLGPEIVDVEGGSGSIAMIVRVHAIRWDGAAATLACLRPCAESGWKRLEEELRDAHREALRASALKSDFLAEVSHEIRTPLNAILGFAEVILDERFGPIGNARYKDYLKDIHASGTLVMSLVNDLLDLARIEAGKVDLVFVPVDANAIVAECVSIMQPQATRERVVVRVSLAPGLPPVLADERSLRQIVLNLLSNAVKFNEPGGQVVVATALAESGKALLCVKDTGIGMSDKEIEIALEPFGRVAGTRPAAGTGLGLPLTKALVEANHAHFSITSRKSEGTIIEITFPPA